MLFAGEFVKAYVAVFGLDAVMSDSTLCTVYTLHVTWTWGGVGWGGVGWSGVVWGGVGWVEWIGVGWGGVGSKIHIGNCVNLNLLL